MAITDDDVAIANARGVEKKESIAKVVGAHYDRRVSRVIVVFISGAELSLPPKMLQGLEHAHPEDLRDIEISPSGLGLHFPKVDADLYIPALLDGIFGTKKWIAEQAGRLGGKSTSEAKAAASRANGKNGGRPKKQLATA